MTRDIKFRFWQPEVEIMSVGLTLREIEQSAIENTKSPFIKDHIPMQFTGLLDKNGKEIYEGDIFKEDLTDEQGNPIVSYVVFKDGMFTDNAGDEPLADIIGRDTNAEIIGNIYENPDLIE